MIILVIYVVGVSIYEFKRQTPIPIYPDPPAIALRALEAVETKPWDVHVIDSNELYQGPPITFVIASRGAVDWPPGFPDSKNLLSPSCRND